MGSVLSWNKQPTELPAPPSRVNDGALPTDLLYDILLCLPANELCRLRLVCRSWRSLISDPGFAKAHASHNPLAICIHHNEDSRASEVRIVDLSGNIIKRVPLKYLSYDLSAQLDRICITPFFGQNTCSILNITTCEATTTTLPDSTRGNETGRFMLGYIPSTREYKVLCTHMYVTRDHEGNYTVEQTCHIVALGAAGSGRWRARPCPPIIVTPQSGRSVVMNGVFYFLPMSQHYINNNPTKVKPDTIALFHMSTEEWRRETLRGPLNSHAVKKLVFNLQHNNLELAILDSCLVMVQHGFQDCSIDLWYLEDVDKGLWTKRCSTQYAPGPGHDYNEFSPPYPLVLLEDGKIVMRVAWKWALRVYDPKRRTWADLTKLEHCYGTSMYTGNLLSADLMSAG